MIGDGDDPPSHGESTSMVLDLVQTPSIQGEERRMGEATQPNEKNGFPSV